MLVWTREVNHFGWRALLGREPGGEGISPDTAAARATSLAGLPPTYISVGTLDLFLEEDLEDAQRLMRAGVPVELHVYPGMYHGCSLAPDAWMSQVEARNSHEALRRALHPRSRSVPTAVTATVPVTVEAPGDTGTAEKQE